MAFTDHCPEKTVIDALSEHKCVHFFILYINFYYV